jgi:hypothetical protein
MHEGRDFLLCAIEWYYSGGAADVSADELHRSAVARVSGIGANMAVPGLPFASLHTVVGDLRHYRRFLKLYVYGLHSVEFRKAHWTSEMESIYKHLWRYHLKFKARGASASLDDLRGPVEYFYGYGPRSPLLMGMRMRYAMMRYSLAKYGEYGDADEDSRVAWLQRCAKNHPDVSELMKRGYSKAGVIDHYVENVLMDPACPFGHHEVELFSETFHVVVASWTPRYEMDRKTPDYTTERDPRFPDSRNKVELGETMPMGAYLCDGDVHFPDSRNKSIFEAAGGSFLHDTWGIGPTINVTLNRGQWYWMQKTRVVAKLGSHDYWITNQEKEPSVEDRRYRYGFTLPLAFDFKTYKLLDETERGSVDAGFKKRKDAVEGDILAIEAIVSEMENDIRTAVEGVKTATGDNEMELLKTTTTSLQEKTQRAQRALNKIKQRYVEFGGGDTPEEHPLLSILRDAIEWKIHSGGGEKAVDQRVSDTPRVSEGVGEGVKEEVGEEVKEWVKDDEMDGYGSDVELE